LIAYLRFAVGQTERELYTMAEDQRTQPSSYVQSSSGTGSYKHSRVTSRVAQSFAADLDSMFGLDTGSSSSVRTGGGGGIDTLAQTVEEK
jgi:hypothetical protein